MARIIIRKVGPILVQGEVELVDQEGNTITPPPAKTPGTFKLCSCGQSGTRPFCDGTHNADREPPTASPETPPLPNPPAGVSQDS